MGAENTTAEKIRLNWDSHEDLVRDHGYWGPILDGGAPAHGFSEISGAGKGSHRKFIHERY
ncbi:MAG: hypothetical protein ACOYNQ_09020, partial [Burkholderiales bacterium]